MARRFLIPLLAAGAIFGFASGIARSHERMRARHDAFERHIASVCVDAARGKGGPSAASPPSSPDDGPGW
jgi:hypothetical protein